MGLNLEDARSEAAGLPARRFAYSLLTRVLEKHQTLDEAGAALASIGAKLPARDLSFARAIVYAALRDKGALDRVCAALLERPLPDHGAAAGRILLAGLAELLVLKVKPHAAVDGAVRLCASFADARGFQGLINAVLRRAARDGAKLPDGPARALANTPGWMLRRWQSRYGADAAAAMAQAHGSQAPLDLTLRRPSDAADWAARLGGQTVGAGSIRLPGAPQVETLTGFSEGAFFVQDAAAAVPAQALARLCGGLSDKRVADLCAAPGGKTLQLAVAGAKVTAVDASRPRMKQLEANLARTGLNAHCVVADVLTFQDAQGFDAILLDAPCTASGTIRRHPDLPWIKQESAIAGQAAYAARLFDAAFALLRPGGVLVFAVCSLEPEEGEEQFAGFLTRQPAARAAQLDPKDYGFPAEARGVDGALRLLPFHLAAEGGNDGFFVAAAIKHS